MPKRHELVKEKAKEQLPDQREVLLAQWYHCALSKTPLREPVVADAAGKLYNRDIILEYLLDKTSYGDGDKVCPYITSLKDVVTLNLTANPAWTETSGDLTSRSPAARFVCPVTLKEMNGRQRFCYIRTCGCAMSNQAIREVSNAKECLKCNKPFDGALDVVPINPPKAEAEKLLEAFETQKAAAKSARKEKKRKNGGGHAGVDGEVEEKKKRKKSPDVSVPASAASAHKATSSGAASAFEAPPLAASTKTMSKAASIIQAYQKEKEAKGIVQSAAVQSLFTSSLKKDRQTKEGFFNRGTLRQIM